MDALTLTTEEVAQQLHTNRNRIQKLREQGLLKGLRLGKSWIYPVTEVQRFLEINKGKDLRNGTKESGTTNTRPE